MSTAQERTDLVTILALERELEAAVGDALRPWLTTARTATLPALTAAAIPPDPDAIGRNADAAWDQAVDTHFLPRISAAVARLLGDTADRLSDWRTRYLADARTRLSGLPERATRRVRAAVKAAAGQTVDVVRAAVDTALSWTEWRADAALIGRNEAISVFNAARLADAEQHARETGVRLDKMWISLHDSKTRHSHMEADRQRVDLDEMFVVGTSLLDRPHDPDAPLEETAGCRCWLQILNSAPLTDEAITASSTGGNTMSGKRFEALLMPTGVIGRSGQGMLSTSVQLVDTALPLALKWQKHDLPAHEGGLTIGAIQELELRDGGLWATGTLLDSPETDEALQQVEAGVTRPSAELVVRSQVMADAAGNTVSLETAEQLYADGAAIVMRWDTVEIVAGTLVSVPEFRDTSITVGEATDAAPPLALVAATSTARIVEPDRYPAEYFCDPGLSEPTPIHVTPEGRVIGHLACWNSQHTAPIYRNRNVTPYHSFSGYAEFHQSVAYLDNGERLRVGRLTVGGGHATAGKGMRPALEHYDNVATCWSLVRAGEDEIGIWVSGAIHASADEAMIKDALGTPHSGHWEPVLGHPELIAAHAVNNPGFLVIEDRDGGLAMVASFAPRPSQPPMSTAFLDEVARRGAAAYAEQLAAQQRAVTAQELVYAASNRRRAVAAGIRADRKAS